MLALLGLAVALILMGAFIYAELHSAWYEITLSSGIDVLVSPEMHEEMVRRFQISKGPDTWELWDEAVLSVLRFERPAEWEYLIHIHERQRVPAERGWDGKRSGPRAEIAVGGPQWLLR
jgi:hypothetical protein